MSEGSSIMLNIQIRSEIKEVLILLIFSVLLRDTLTGVTVALVFFGAIMVWLGKKPTHLVRNIITLGLFAAYWIIFGKVIDPEVGMNFLTSIVVLKLLEKESVRDRYMIFFGIILLVSAGSLFERSLSYVFFFAISFYLLIQDFYKNLNLKAKMWDLLKSLLWVLPFTVIMFFFVPRMINPFQMEKGTPRKGEVGYTPEVDISQVESLSYNDSVVFQASVESQISNDDLYWRGNTLSFSDGWNWPLMPQDRYQKPFRPNSQTVNYQGIKQNIRIFAQQDFYFGLDHPSLFMNSKGAVELDSLKTLLQSQWQPSLKYQVISVSESITSDALVDLRKFNPGLKKLERNWINEHFKTNTLRELEGEIKQYFLRESFSYSLSPGRVESLIDFLRDKKIGFCSHYASAVAQILRVKQIPARLVSGFMGGTYNKYAGFYQISQNDAHVWVEAYDQGKWIRLDPTGWIAPDRIRLGGEAFMQQVNPAPFSGMNVITKNFKFIHRWQQWFAHLDYRFYQWLEEMDYYGQDHLFEKLKFKREWIFSFLPICIVFFMGIYLWHLNYKKRKRSEIESLWIKFQQKMKVRGVHVEFVSLSEGKNALTGQDQIVQSVWNQLIEASFKANDEKLLSVLKKKIKNL
jgi:hypothetical protein